MHTILKINTRLHMTKLEKIITKELILYGIIGLIGGIIDLTAFQGLTVSPLLKDISWRIELFNFIGSSISLTHNFFMNAFINFKTKDHLLIRFIKYYLIGQFTTLFVSLCLFIFSIKLGLPALFIKIGAAGVATLLQFFINRVFTFKKD